MFVHYNNSILNTNNISFIDCSNFASSGYITIHLNYRSEKVFGNEAINIIMALCPAVLEGHRMKYARNAWAIHNLVGHPLMQIFSWLHLTQLGIWMHDITVPKPKEKDGD